MQANPVVKFIRVHIVYIAFVILTIVFSFLSPQFASTANAMNIMRQASLLLIVACGMTFTIISGEIDLSVGSIAALAGLSAALFMQSGSGPILAFGGALLIGALFGAANGFFTAKMGIPSFLVTLGSMEIARGIAMSITDTRPVVIYQQSFSANLATLQIGQVQIFTVWALLIAFISFVVLHKSKFGRHVYAVGGNPVAARFSGVNTVKIKLITLMLNGVLAAFTGLLLAARMGAARPNVGATMNLDAIAAVILGGASMAGGKGVILGTITGVLIFSVINNGLIMIGLNPHIQMAVKGAVIIAAVIFTDKT